jgi:hypothetical protein
MIIFKYQLLKSYTFEGKDMRVSISSSLCEFVGAIIGDGNLWTDGSRHRIELTGNPTLDRAYFIYLSKIAFKVFKKRPYLLKIRERGLRFRLQSKHAFDILIELGIPAGKGKFSKVKIPEQIIAKGWNYVKWTIRGIADSDGTLFFSKKTYKSRIYPTIEIRTCSKELALQITKILRQRDFRARLRGNEKIGFHVALYGHKMLRKWMNDIGFSNTRHSSKLQEHKNLYEKDHFLTKATPR